MALVWKKVVALFEQRQKMISQNQKECAQVFGIKLQKSYENWQPQEDSLLLQLERRVHQVAPLQGKSSLRIDANRWLDSSLFNPPPSQWLVSSAKKFSDPHSLKCLQQRIVDVCLCPPNDLAIKTKCLKRIELKSKKEIGAVVLQEHANQEHILDLTDILE